MLLIWRGRGLLAVAALFPLMASCAGLIEVKPGWLCPVASSVSLMIGGAICVYFGTRWNRPVVEHSFYFIPLQVWGWIYLAVVCTPSLLIVILGALVTLGLKKPARGADPNGPSPIYGMMAGLGFLLLVLVEGYLLIRITKSKSIVTVEDQGERDKTR